MRSSQVQADIPIVPAHLSSGQTTQKHAAYELAALCCHVCFIHTRDACSWDSHTMPRTIRVLAALRDKNKRLTLTLTLTATVPP